MLFHCSKCFFFIETPRITSISSQAAHISGGTYLQIYGEHLAPLKTIRVRFRPLHSTNQDLTVSGKFVRAKDDNSAHIECRTPAMPSVRFPPPLTVS